MSLSTPQARTEPASDAVFELRNTSVTFDGTSRVLNAVDLTIRREEILGIVGESGSGKSMLASSLLNAVEEPGRLSGEVIYHPQSGDPVDLCSLSDSELKRIRWNEIAFVIQAAQSAFNPTMTVRDHFIETLNSHGVNVENGLERSRELLSDVYLDAEQVFPSYPHQLSGGMKQRALIALSLILNPDVLVMDEPTAALDLLMQRSIVSLLFDLKQKYDLTLVFVTHDLPLVADIADRLGVMYAFELAEVAPTDQIIGAGKHPYTRLLINSVPDIQTTLDQSNAIPGTSPDPTNVPPGCSFQNRCPIAGPDCSEIDPERTNVGDDHQVACHYWSDSADEIPFTKDNLSLGGDGDE